MAYKNKLDPRAREARLKHYYKNKESYLLKNKQKRELIRATIQEYKNKPCKDCGQLYPYYVMDFDHLTDKLYTISTLVNSGSLEKALKEMEKCDVVCANCHRIRTNARVVRLSFNG